MQRSSLPSDHAVARRTLLRVAGLGAGVGMVGGFPSTGQGGAETAGSAPAGNARSGAANTGPKKAEGQAK
jgi:hypothetical protein